MWSPPRPANQNLRKLQAVHSCQRLKMKCGYIQSWKRVLGFVDLRQATLEMRSISEIWYEIMWLGNGGRVPREVILNIENAFHLCANRKASRSYKPLHHEDWREFLCARGCFIPSGASHGTPSRINKQVAHCSSKKLHYDRTWSSGRGLGC